MTVCYECGNAGTTFLAQRRSHGSVLTSLDEQFHSNLFQLSLYFVYFGVLYTHYIILSMHVFDIKA
jgi:hypothetical protein